MDKFENSNVEIKSSAERPHYSDRAVGTSIVISPIYLPFTIVFKFNDVKKYLSQRPSIMRHQHIVL